MSRIARWRKGRSSGPPTKNSSRFSSCRPIAVSGRCFTLAAASSIAKGRPSSLRQISSTSDALCRSSWRSGITACARSQKSFVAGQPMMSSAGSSPIWEGDSRGGTGNSCSPRNRRALRLVTTKVVSGQLCTSEYTSGAAGVRCSRVSSTIRKRLPARCLIKSCSRLGPASATPIVLASSGATSDASFTSPSETKKQPSGKDSCISRAASRASRVFPMPPGPVNVSSLTRPASSVALMPSSSRDRPRSGVSADGSPPAVGMEGGLNTRPRASASNLRRRSSSSPRAEAIRLAVS